MSAPRHAENTYVSNPVLLDEPAGTPRLFWAATAAGVVAVAVLALAVILWR